MEPIRQMPDDATILHGSIERGVALHRTGDLVGAARHYERALAIDPDQIDATHLRGVVERHIGLPARGLTMIGRAARSRPKDAAIRGNLELARAQVLPLANDAYRQGDFEAAATLIKALIDVGGVEEDEPLRRSLVAMLHNAALVLNERAESALGRRCIELVWRLEKSATTHTLLLILRLAERDYRAAWDAAAWRASGRGPDAWNGEPHPGTLVVTNQNGMGDLVQFLRFIPHARKRVGRLVLLLRREMAALIQGSPMLEGVEVVTEHLGDPDFVHCELFTLPAAMGLDERHVPVSGPYIIPPADEVADWRRALRRDDRPHIGVAWSHWRSEDLRSPGYGFFHDLITRHPEAVFVGISADFGKRDLRGGDFPENFRFFGPSHLPTTVRILASMDLMIAPCGGMAHLSGTLGLEVWTVLRRHCDWRWRFYDGHCDWYPKTRLFHQAVEGDWSDVHRRVDRELTRFLAERRGIPPRDGAASPT